MVEGVGFEPTKAEPSDLQSDPFGRSGTPPKKNQAGYFEIGNSYCQQALRLLDKKIVIFKQAVKERS